MALIKCPECSREISDKAEACPHCGFPVAKSEIKSHNSHIEDTMDNSSSISSNSKLEPDTSNYSSEDREKEVAFAVKSLFIIIGVFIAIFVVATLYQNIEKKEMKRKGDDQKRSWFNAAKTLIKENKVSDSELESVKASLQSVDKDMPEYKESQELLLTLLKQITAVEKAKEAKATETKKSALAKLLPKFRITKDKIDGSVTYRHKNYTPFFNTNGTGIMAKIDDNEISELSLKRRYDLFCRTHRLFSCFRRDNHDYQRVAKAFP